MEDAETMSWENSSDYGGKRPSWGAYLFIGAIVLGVPLALAWAYGAFG